MAMKQTWMTALLMTALGLSACAEDFESFNTVSRLRVLAVQLDPPDVAPGEQAVATALVAGGTGDVTYEWSWCPLTAGSVNGYECLVTQEEFATALAFAGTGASLPAFDLGTDPQALFDYQMDGAALQALCALALQQQAPAFVALPSCDDRFVATLMLTVRDDEDEVTAVKELPLLFSADTGRNGNPSIGAVTFFNEAGIALEEITRSERVDVFADVPLTASESFIPAATNEVPDPVETREILFMTWFVTAGELAFTRTGYIDGETAFEDIQDNSWKVDDGDEATLYLVLQDERGGVVWKQIDVQVEGRP